MPRPKGVHNGVRRAHQAHILRLLKDHGALSRTELGELMGLSRASLVNISAELLEQGAITVTEAQRGEPAGRGRPLERLALNPRSGTFMGVEFGLRRVQVAVVNASHQIIAKGRLAYGEDEDWHRRIVLAFDLIDELRADSGVAFDHFVGVGIGIIGPVRAHGSNTADDGAPRFALPVSTIEDIRSAFEVRFGADVYLDNNTRLAALAEAGWGSGLSVDDLLYVRISDGVGGGMVVGGSLLTGGAGLAGQIGHITVDPDGVDCRCGKRGCLETITSVTAVLRDCRAIDADLESLAQVVAAAEAGDERIIRRLETAGEALGRVLATLAVAVNPSQIVLAGELMRLDRIAFARAQQIFTAGVPALNGYQSILRPGRLGEEDGALGAILAAFRRSSLLEAFTDDSQSARPGGLLPTSDAHP